RRVLGLRARGTQVVDLGAAVITPGLVDCHTHFFYWALGRALVIDVSELWLLDDVLRKIRAQAKTKRLGDWIVARGFDHNRWAAEFPTAADLDRAVSEQPVMVHSRDEHSAWLNTAALRRCRITSRTPDPKGGRYLRDARGRPTGIVQEAALQRLPDPLRDFARRRDPSGRRIIDRALDAAYRTAWGLGIVGVHVLDDGPSLSHLLRHHATRRLGLRVVHAVAWADLEHACQLGLRSGFGEDWFRLGGVKIFADGALGSQTAYMFQPYPGRGDYCGVPVVAGEELKETLRKAVQHGWAAWIHAIGDRAVHEAVDAIAAARRLGNPALPHRIEHVQCVRPADARRMARLNIVASVQPCHLLGDITTADRHWPRARRNTFAFRRLLDSGVTLAGGSDVPIESLDPRRSLFAATMRTDEHGEPAGGWFPEQRISARDALLAFTRGAALASGNPAPTGTLAPGAPADLTIWADDPFRACPAELLQAGILGCVVDGQVHLTAEA
ncbi:MAG: amidohydrolase, partial [Phycisphaerae bacterium]|nr:amidohydrolase [Phycisphaerae bacterium]